MAARGVAVDLATLRDSMVRTGSLKRAGGEDFLMDLNRELSASAALVSEHCRIIRDASQRRQVKRALGAALEALQDPTVPLVEVAGMAEAAALAGVAGLPGEDRSLGLLE